MSLGFICLKPWASASGGVLESFGTLRRYGQTEGKEFLGNGFLSV